MKPQCRRHPGLVSVMCLEKLEQAYRATTYVAFPEAAEIRIRVGKSHPKLDTLLRTHALASWAFLTACNPCSERLPDAENAQRMAALRSELNARGSLFCEGLGIGEGEGWPAEPSFLVLGITRDEAVETAVRYGQYAFVYGEFEGRAELVWTTAVPKCTLRSAVAGLDH